MTYFTSDLHLGHENILSLCSRPFETVEKMDETIIENWNKRVKKNDVVFVLGDVVWDKKRLASYMARLMGTKILIAGNHDAFAKNKELCAPFKEVHSYLEKNLDGHPITMCHYPMLEWNKSRREMEHRLGFLIHGHIHNRISSDYRQLYIRHNALNAGVDINGFAPVTFDELLENNLRFKLSALESDADRELLLSGLA